MFLCEVGTHYTARIHLHGCQINHYNFEDHRNCRTKSENHLRHVAEVETSAVGRCVLAAVGSKDKACGLLLASVVHESVDCIICPVS